MSFSKRVACAALGLVLVAPTPLAAQTADPSSRLLPTAQQRAVGKPVQLTIPTSDNWWRSAAGQALSQRRAPSAAPPRGAQTQVQPQPTTPEARSRKRHGGARALARRSTPSRRELARREKAEAWQAAREVETIAPQPQIPAQGGPAVLLVATGLDGSAASRPGAEVVQALARTASVAADGRQALSRGDAQLAVAPSLDGSLGDAGERVTKLFDAVVLVVARRDVTAPGELAGRAVEIGQSDADAAVARDALKVMGIEVAERRSTQREAIVRLVDGRSAGAVLVAAKGSPDIAEALELHGDLHIVSVASAAPDTRTKRLTVEDVPGLAEAEDLRALPAEISLFARRGHETDPAIVSAVRALYSQIPQLLASGAGPWWRSVPLAAEATEASAWTPTKPDLASTWRDALAEGLERVGLERAIAARDATRLLSPKLWVVGP